MTTALFLIGYIVLGLVMAQKAFVFMYKDLTGYFEADEMDIAFIVMISFVAGCLWPLPAVVSLMYKYVLQPLRIKMEQKDL